MDTTGAGFGAGWFVVRAAAGAGFAPFFFRSLLMLWVWAEAGLPQAGCATALQKLPEAVRELLLTTLAAAA